MLAKNFNDCLNGTFFEDIFFKLKVQEFNVHPLELNS